MISAFDEAIMSPFIQESSTKKKWNCRGNSFTSDTTATTATMLEEEDFAPTDEETANDQAPLILANQHDTIMFVQEDDIELAVLQERKEDIVEINQSMKQINSIQKDIANIVVEQSDDLERMSWNAIQTFENTQSGLEQVVQARRYYQLSPKERRERLILAVTGAMVVLIIALYKLQPSEDAASGANGSIKVLP